MSQANYPAGAEAADLRGALASLFPPWAGIGSGVGDEYAGPLEPAEEKFIQKASTVRARQFAGGRRAAREALWAVCGERQAIPPGPDGVPQWPTGVVGSISHKPGVFAAVVVPTAKATGVGLDVEHLVAPPDAPDIASHVLSAGERRTMATGVWGISGPAGVRLAFCIKECVFKALFPQIRRHFGFAAVEVFPRVENGSFSAAWQPQQAGFSIEPARFEGRLARWKDYGLAGMVLGSRKISLR